jgi:nicotinate phosphoribosyltransferase
VAAAREFDIPGSGTIPHALVQAYADELTSFRAVATSLPEYSLLLDTYDVAQGLEHAITVSQDVRASHGHRMSAVRLDSGDLEADSRMCRARLDEVGMEDVRVLASGDIDEYKIERFLRHGAPIDSFGVGGNLGVGLGTVESGTVGGVIGAVYKLAWYGGDDDEGASARIKLAGGGDKSTWPGQKVITRMGDFEHDLIGLEGESPPPGGRRLLQPIVEHGHLIADVPSIKEARERAEASLAALPHRLRELTVTEPYEVRVSDAVQTLRSDTIARLEANRIDR